MSFAKFELEALAKAFPPATADLEGDFDEDELDFADAFDKK